MGQLSNLVSIDSDTIARIKASAEGSPARVVNLVKRIEKDAQNNSEVPYLIAMAERGRLVQDNVEHRQTSTSKAPETLRAQLEQVAPLGPQAAGSRGVRRGDRARTAACRP